MSNGRRRLLFVDDEPRILEGIARMLRPQRAELEVLTAPGGAEALALLATEGVDVVISDMRMPLMDGAELLAAVRQRHPRVVRIILSGQSDRDTIVRASRPAHQFLSKPCDPQELRATIARACALRDLLPDPALQERIAALEGMPSAPGVLADLDHELANGASPERVSRLIAGDVGLAAKITQLTTTSFFGTPHGVMAPAEAARRLGMDVLRALTQAGALPGPAEIPGFDWVRWDRDARRTAALARAFAEASDPALATAAELAGLLHDCGQAALVASLGQRYEPIASLPRHETPSAELAAFGCSHGDAGAFLLALWGLPDEVVESVARHHTPSVRAGRHDRLVALVHAAASLASETALDAGFIASAGLAGHLDAWRARAAEQT